MPTPLNGWVAVRLASTASQNGLEGRFWVVVTGRDELGWVASELPQPATRSRASTAGTSSPGRRTAVIPDPPLTGRDGARSVSEV
ncbi:hypothetical protein Ae406Ps2_1733c [Pseudonocardia sp. Ae406_Ps2]|nr:hypothetical protein Ae406Ps2_1733c [Pseudonocardia sp. Ae406_Ps2]OLM13222.1 hypothetical protein Ae505Ps2_3350 [Pseudonocardia sp. Ae505_Ps2]OLM23303.1 hypothetical protein Ae706Ps2_1736c [Pseudonocardia sp. Ae706_Ps2]